MMKKQIEIEIKLPIKSGERVAEKLEKMGFLMKKTVREEDLYFNGTFHDVAEKGEALRVRRVTEESTGKILAEINFKGPKVDRISMTRREWETRVADPKVMEEILIALDYNPVFRVEKRRRYYEKGRMTACLDHLEKLGDFLELEVLAESEEERPQVLLEMEEILNSLGHQMKETVRTSYMSMLMKKSGAE